MNLWIHRGACVIRDKNRQLVAGAYRHRGCRQVVEIDPGAGAPTAQIILNDSVEASSVVIAIVPTDLIGMYYLFGDPGGAALFGGYTQNEGNNVVGTSWVLNLNTVPAGHGASMGYFRYWMLHPAQR